MKVSQFNTIIMDNVYIDLNYYLMKIFTPEISSVIKPGQFINLKVTNTYDPLLKRPFSPYLIDKKKGIIEVFYKVVGKGTKLMSSYKKGDKLIISGPHGNKFTIPEDAVNVAIVGRGVGTAPLVFLSQTLYEKNINIFAFLSTGESSYLVGKDDLEKFNAKIFSTTTNKELVTDILWKMLEGGLKIDAIYTCGSRRLRREVAKMASKYGILSQVSLEEIMACGIGVCMGCAVKIGTPSSWKYKRVCVEGPVFETQEVIDE